MSSLQLYPNDSLSSLSAQLLAAYTQKKGDRTPSLDRKSGFDEGAGTNR